MPWSAVGIKQQQEEDTRCTGVSRGNLKGVAQCYSYTMKYERERERERETSW